MKRLIYLTILSVVFAQEDQGCIINIANLEQEPIVLDLRTFNFLYPPDYNPLLIRDVIIPVEETIIITCPGGNLTTDSGPEATIYATCNLQAQLVYNDKYLNFSSLSCSNPRTESVRYTTEKCADNGRVLVIGYEIGLDINFVPIIRICFDEVNRTPLWTYYHLSRSINYREYSTPTFIEDPQIYNLNVPFDTLYTMDYERTLINSRVGLPPESHKWIDYRPFFRETLAHTLNFIYRFQTNATGHFMNTIPRWVLTGAYYNWGLTESSVVQYVQTNHVDLEVYTGTWGVSTLPHEETGEDVEIYLYEDERGFAIPVPEIFWKLVFEPTTRRATVLLTLNNPYQTNLTKNILCDDISDGMRWIGWRGKTVLYHGYSYACTYHELLQKIDYLPKLDVVGILD